MSGLSAQLHFVAGAGIEGSFDLQVDLALPQSGVTAVFGESGSGKTTLLRCLAGLERGATGRVSFGDTVWQDAAVFVPTHLRRIGYVFQESSLLSHLTVLANLRYGARRARMEGDTGFEPVVELMGIVSLLQKYPAQLSGGERQRVAIARSLLQRPRLLLMDEPLAALDAARKQEILPYLEELPRQFDLPIVYVTHSLDEVARLAQRLVVLREGRVVADGALTEVMSDLSLPMQLGEQAGVVLDGVVAERDRNWQLLRIEFAGGELWVRDGGDALGQSIRIRVLARDVSLAMSSHDDSSIINRLSATVTELEADQDPAMLLAKLSLGERSLIARISRRSAHHLGIEIGTALWAQIKSVAILR